MDTMLLSSALQENGFICRGAFHPGPADHVPAATRTVLLIGNAGPAMWHAFVADASTQTRASPHPLDNWTRRTLTALAQQFSAHAMFPFDGPPFLPFQDWARRAEPVFVSPLKILIHPRYGLWHAYRGALALTERLPLTDRDMVHSPCLTCSGRPCLTACPAGAITDKEYGARACADYLRAPVDRDCMDEGCRARRACPIGDDHRYVPEQAAFHVRAFARGFANAAEPRNWHRQ